MVFDGAQLPMKANEEKERRKNRADNKRKALQFYKIGDKENGYKYMQRAIHISQEMVNNLIKRLRKEGIEFIVAPYEGIHH